MIASAAARSHATAVMRAVTKQRGLSALAPHIARSWSRCIEEYGMRPEVHRDTPVLSSEHLRERRRRLGALLGVAHRELQRLYGSIGETGRAVTLSDADGVVLEAIADPRSGREFRRLGLLPGARWDEPCQGTNGIGTCLAESVPTTVFRGEHLRDCNVRLSCAGAPIVDAHGKAVAILCASSANPADTREAQRHAVALVSQSAALVSRHRFLDEFADAWILRFHRRPESIGMPQEALIAIDDYGTILAMGERTLPLLGSGTREDLVGRPIQTLFDFDANAMHQRMAHAAGTLWSIRDVPHGRQFQALLRPPRARRARVRGAARSAHSDAIDARHIVADPRMRQNLASGQRLLASRIPVLLHGATGTGKDLLARALHARGPWADRPFITVNCAAIPAHILDSGLSDGLAESRGATDPADPAADAPYGTLLLDEVGDLPPTHQAWLLRAIEAHRISLAGAAPAAGHGWYVISASHRDLPEMVRSGGFRADLYYRLAGATLELPALKDRSDKVELIDTLLVELSSAGEPLELSASARQHLLRHDWPGNIRELRNTLRTAAALCADNVIRTANLPREILASDQRTVTTSTVGAAPATVASALRDAECDALARVLSQFDWNVTRAAQALAVSRNTLYRKLRKHGITPPARR